MRKTLLATVTLLLSFYWLAAQQASTKDSLLHLLKASKEDSNKAKLQLAIGQLYVYNNIDSAHKYYQDALALSKKINYENGIWNYYRYHLDVLNLKGLKDSAVSFSAEMLEWAKKTNDSTKIGLTLYSIGYLRLLLHDNINAIKYFEQSRSILEHRFGNEKVDGYSYYYLAMIAGEMRQFQKAVNYGSKAVEKFRQSGATTLLAMAALNTGYSYILLKKYDSARNYLNNSLSIFEQANEAEGVVLSKLNFGYIYMLQRDFEKMKPYADTCLLLSRKYALTDCEGRSLWGLSVYYLSKKEYGLAKQYADSSFSIAKKMSDSQQGLRLLLHFSNLSFAMQDANLGYYYQSEYESLRDSLINNDIQKIIADNEINFETEKKEAQIKLQQAALKQRNTLNYFLTAAAFALFIILLLGYRNYTNKQKLQQTRIDELETEKQLTATEAVLKGEEQERTRLAKDLHDGLGGILSGIKFSLSNVKENLILTPDNAQAFERSMDMLDSSIQEMRRVAHNMMPEMLVKYGLDVALKEFCSQMNNSGAVQVNYQSVGMRNEVILQTTSVTIYRIVQELVNNAMKHAAAKNILVQVHMAEQEKLLAITVEDDGIGFDTAILKQAKGIGWQNMQNRVEFLKGKIDIQSSPGKGTSVMIEIAI
ncbi:MAG: sensor histidine kinase [Chitinophagaceae bacterium]